MAKMTRRLGTGEEPIDPEAGAFMGFHSSESSDSESEGRPLLQGLENWLDRLFEGSTHRYYINYWPDFPTK
jgi:DnaJ homolog subfamily C member 16